MAAVADTPAAVADTGSDQRGDRVKKTLDSVIFHSGCFCRWAAVNIL